MTTTESHEPAQFIRSQKLVDTLQNFFVAELLGASPLLWLYVSHLDDFDILDNSTRSFAGLEPDWPNSSIRLSQVLKALLTRGTKVQIIYRECAHTGGIEDNLNELKQQFDGQLGVLHDPHSSTNRILGDHYYFSWNLKMSTDGNSIEDEHLTIYTDQTTISEQTIEFEETWIRLAK